MKPPWFKQRRYRHFDRPVGMNFIESCNDPGAVSRHSYSPLIRYVKVEKRYKRRHGQKSPEITLKRRPICYASHRDACILDLYASDLRARLETYYLETGISDGVIAYRSLGKANYHFAAEALAFANANAPVVILTFDVTEFFDNLDHQILKSRLRYILDVGELPYDWFSVFRFITKYRYIELEYLKAHPQFQDRFDARNHGPIATISELKATGIPLFSNPDPGKGIPQGTPISAAAANLYMMDFDVEAARYFSNNGSLYRRYSDDILLICKPELADDAERKIVELIESVKLHMAEHKTERTFFSGDDSGQIEGRSAQYLGFHLDHSGASIRPSSLARQWRRMRRSMKRARRLARYQKFAGKSGKVYTKKLRRRFTNLKVYNGITLRQVRNFSSYGRRSAQAFGSGEKIVKQLKRLERAAERELAELKNLGN